MTELNEKDKKTINEWEEFSGITIMDPDGFDRKNPNLYNELFTYDEFMTGVIGSTIKSADPKKFHDFVNKLTERNDN